MEKNFDTELEEILQGISKIQEHSEKALADSHKSGSLKKRILRSPNTRHLDVAEATRQSMRPEAAVWLGFAALISSNDKHSNETRRLASKLGGHLARRRAKPLGKKYEQYRNVTISPRCRKLVGALSEFGSEIEEVFGVWIRMRTQLTCQEVLKISGCIWPAINCIEKDNQTDVLIPRFPERMPLVLKKDSADATFAQISEEGKLNFIFWMDEGIVELPKVCGIAWLSEGLFPLVANDCED